jgi:hypothetical protein
MKTCVKTLCGFGLLKAKGLSVKAKGGSVSIQSLTVYILSSAWKDGMGD